MRPFTATRSILTVFAVWSAFASGAPPTVEKGQKPQVVIILSGGFRSEISRVTDDLEKHVKPAIDKLLKDGRYDVLVVKTYYGGPKLEPTTVWEDMQHAVPYAYQPALSYSISKNG